MTTYMYFENLWYFKKTKRNAQFYAVITIYDSLCKDMRKA